MAMPVRFAQVVPGIYRGGEPSAEQLRTLHDKYDVKRVVSLDASISAKIDPIVKSLGMEHITIGIDDNASLTDSLRYLQRNIINITNNRPVYIHCQFGKDRTGLAVALFRIANGMTPEQALSEARTYGFGIGLSAARLNLYTKIILMAKTVPAQTDLNASDTIVGLERDMLAEPANKGVYDSRQSFSPISPVPQTLEDVADPFSTENFESNVDHARSDDKNRLRRRKMRKMMMEDINHAMPEVGMYGNDNPILRGLGPIEPGGILPSNTSFAY